MSSFQKIGMGLVGVLMVTTFLLPGHQTAAFFSGAGNLVGTTGKTVLGQG